MRHNNGYRYLAELRLRTDTMTAKEYTHAFTCAVVEFFCDQGGQTAGQMFNMVQDCNFDLDESIRRLEFLRNRALNKDGERSLRLPKGMKLEFERSDND